MDVRRVEIAKLMKTNPNDGLKAQGKIIREDLKQLKESSYFLEDNFIHKYLGLPNVIHFKTPAESKNIIFSHLEPPTKIVKSAVELSEIEFFDATCYYLKGDAAKFDLFYPMHVTNFFKSFDYVPFSNPDFTRSIIAEGAGVNPNKLLLLKEDDIENKLNLLYLTGSGSLYNYLAFVTKLTVYPSIFPLQFICSGRQYLPHKEDITQNAHNVVQSTCNQIFVATANQAEAESKINEIIEHYKLLYQELDQHFRVFYHPAHSLGLSESLKVGFEMFSTSLQEYVEIGNISYHGEFISKRLLFNYKEGKDFNFPHVISGQVMDIMKLLLVLERNGNFQCPQFLDT